MAEKLAELVEDLRRDFWDILPAERRRIWTYYGFAGFFEDGYLRSRSKLIDGKEIAHPIHGAYLIVELLNQYLIGKKKDQRLLDYAFTIAKASIARMKEIGGSLRFMYHPGDGVTPYQFSFYSALTQVRYLGAFMRLRAFADGAWVADAIRKIYNSFSVPVEEGGVLLRNAHGLFFEEYPTEVPTYVLNGWLTVLNELFAYGYQAKDKSALELAKESTKTLIKLLPLYDMPEMMTSRYKLTGFVLNHVKFSEGFSGIVDGIEIFTGGQRIEKNLRSDSRIYDTVNVSKFPEDAPNNSLRFKVTLCMIDYPESCKLTLRVYSSTNSTAKWFVAIPQFNPRYYTPKAVGQRLVSTIDLTPGMNEITIAVPWDLAIGWVGTAVPFSKFVGGKFYNAYHYIHVTALSQLNEFFPSRSLLHWRDKWLKYSDGWSNFHLYNQPDICLSVLDAGRFPTQQEYLKAPKVVVRNGEIVRSSDVGQSSILGDLEVTDEQEQIDD